MRPLTLSKDAAILNGPPGRVAAGAIRLPRNRDDPEDDITDALGYGESVAEPDGLRAPMSLMFAFCLIGLGFGAVALAFENAEYADDRGAARWWFSPVGFLLLAFWFFALGFNLLAETVWVDDLVAAIARLASVRS
jgi:hypothetical protein